MRTKRTTVSVPREVVERIKERYGSYVNISAFVSDLVKKTLQEDEKK